MTGTVRASVLIPTHSHFATLPMTVRSALAQNMADLEVLIIGDGVDEATRDAAEALQRGDQRVRFLDLPKGDHHGEAHRHTAICEARSEVIAYLCDDDLLLPDHVGDMVELLQDHDFAQSLNGWVTSSGQMKLYPTDLSLPEAIEWHLLEPRRNMVSLTGTAHTRTSYLALADPWETTPAEQWPDHFMWKKFFRTPGLRAVTSTRMTALQFPSSSDGRDEWSDEDRAREIEPWAYRVARPDAQDDIDRLVAAASRRILDELSRSEDVLARGQAQLLTDVAQLTAENGVMSHEIEGLRDETARLVGENDLLVGERNHAWARVDRLLGLKRRFKAELEQSERALETAQARLAAIELSRSWRITRPLRGLRGAVGAKADTRDGCSESLR